MVKVYYDQDADLSYLKDKTSAIIGYGNQGKAQAMNMRDSGLSVIIGSIKDASWDEAVEDGFQVYPIKEASQKGDIIFLLIPDEVQKDVYEKEIKEALTSGKALNFAHGYNIRYGLIKPPEDVDVIMVAPRMIGVRVRTSFVEGTGVPSFLAVEQDASGHAKDIALAISKAIGSTRVGVLESSFAEETELDLFSEQFIWPVITRTFRLSFELLVEAGYSPEIVALELYGSEEASEVFREMARVGFFKQMSFHSHTSQYGTLTRGPRVMPEEEKELIKEILEEIKDGSFSKEWEEEQKKGYPIFNRLKEEALQHPMNQAEENIGRLIKGLRD